MLSAKQPPGGPRRAQEEIFQPGGRFVLRPRGGEILGVVPKDGPAARRLPGTIRPDPVPQRGVHLLWPGSTTPGRREPCRVVGGGGIPRPGQDGNLARKDRRSLRAALPPPRGSTESGRVHQDRLNRAAGGSERATPRGIPR